MHEIHLGARLRELVQCLNNGPMKVIEHGIIASPILKKSPRIYSASAFAATSANQ